MKLSIVMPIYNESEILLGACNEFSSYFEKYVGHSDWQFIFVENGSNDNSLEVISELLNLYKGSVLVTLQKADYGNALREGIAASQGENIMIMNIDHLWDTDYFVWAWKYRNEYDLIIGSKRADPTLNMQDNYRKILSSGLNSLLAFFFDSVVADTHGMKMLKKTPAQLIADKCVMRRGQFDTELTLRLLREQYSIAEIPMPYLDKRKPKNYMLKKIHQNVIDIFTLIKVMKNIEYKGSIKYRRFCVDDLVSTLNDNGK